MSLLQEIVEKGDGIYRAKYKRDCEQRYFGQYIAIDVETGDGFIAASAAAAIRSGQSAGKLDALGRFQNQLQGNWVTKYISRGDPPIAQNGFRGRNPWGAWGRRHQCGHGRCAGCWRTGSVAG